MNGAHVLYAICISLGLRLLYMQFRRKEKEIGERRYEPVLRQRKATEAEVTEKKMYRMTEKVD